MTVDLQAPLLLVGAGKMGGAMLAGWLEQGLDPQLIWVQDPSPPAENLDLLAKYEIPCSSAPEVPHPPAVIVLAIKPQLMDEAAPRLKSHVGPATLVVSIAAGRSLTGLANHLGPEAAVVRAMPNTPASIGRGITVACPNAHVTPAQIELCNSLLEAVGEVVWVDDEDAMDPVTAVSGSGPAYLFYLTECLAKAGVEAGLSPEISARIAEATVSGAGELLRQSGRSPSELRENVTSPGGTTAAALEILMGKEGLQDLMTRAVAAAARRSKELST